MYILRIINSSKTLRWNELEVVVDVFATWAIHSAFFTACNFNSCNDWIIAVSSSIAAVSPDVFALFFFSSRIRDPTLVMFAFNASKSSCSCSIDGAHVSGSSTFTHGSNRLFPLAGRYWRSCRALLGRFNFCVFDLDREKGMSSTTRLTWHMTCYHS